ncbi:MAG: hypothetical protein ABIV43_00355 [Candidatus Saccharimonadales bacterium]
MKTPDILGPERLYLDLPVAATKREFLVRLKTLSAIAADTDELRPQLYESAQRGIQAELDRSPQAYIGLPAVQLYLAERALE